MEVLKLGLGPFHWEKGVTNDGHYCKRFVAEDNV